LKKECFLDLKHLKSWRKEYWFDLVYTYEPCLLLSCKEFFTQERNIVGFLVFEKLDFLFGPSVSSRRKEYSKTCCYSFLEGVLYATTKHLLKS